MNSKREILERICSNIKFNLKSFSALSGGDINEVYLIETIADKLVVKLNYTAKFPGMFEAEAKGLQLLKSKSNFVVPEVFYLGEVEEYAYLVMEYIEQGKPRADFSSEFGKKLAELHQNSNSHFGLNHSNYIGSLPQKNPRIVKANDFYVYHRLAPQFELAQKNGFKFNNLEKFYRKAMEVIPDEAPSLIHGDLWGGNYMTNLNGKPVLIDPAVVYAPREMDLAMMQLFGGFDQAVFEAYQQHFPLVENWKSRIELFQLYYLLVHLNLFGSSYLSSVNKIIKKYLD